MIIETAFANDGDCRPVLQGDLDVKTMDSTAAAISTLHAKVGRLHITDLPASILIDIFNYFRHTFIDEYGNEVSQLVRDEAQRRFRDICNARLACRTLYRCASPHLCPILRLPFEGSSLDIADGISKSPFILEGIRAIEISTQYRPREIAESLALFTKQRLADLEYMHRSCAYYEETWFLGGDDSDDESICPLPKWVYQEAMQNYDEICSTWRQNPDSSPETSNNEKIAEYRRILHRGYTEYRKKHEKQIQMIVNGSFGNSIQRLVSRVPRGCSFKFTDNDGDFGVRYHDDPTLLSKDMEELSRHMSTPHEWRKIEELDNEVDFTCSTLLAILLITTHQQGTIVQGISTDCFPVMENHYGICGGPGKPSWDDLDAACKQLKSFKFSLHHKSIRFDHPQGVDKACLDRYFSAMLSSSYLEYIVLNLYAYTLNDGRNDHSLAGRHLNMDMGSVLCATDYPLLKEAFVSHVSMQQTELESFCRSLGENLQELRLYEIEMDGSWINTLDILHGRFSTRCLEGRCKLHLDDLYGGEFGARELREEDPMGLDFYDFKMPERKPLIVRAEKYVNGDIEVAKNPLK